MFLSLTFDENLERTRKNLSFAVLRWLGAKIMGPVYTKGTLTGVRAITPQLSGVETAALEAFGTISIQEKTPWTLRVKQFLRKLLRMTGSPEAKLLEMYAEELRQIREKIILALSRKRFRIEVETQVPAHFISFFCYVQVFAEQTKPGWWLAHITF